MTTGDTWFGVTVRTGGEDVNTPPQRHDNTVSEAGTGGEIGRLRHFKSPDDWGVRDDGYMGVAFLS